jgi:hypothetical protein
VKGRKREGRNEKVESAPGRVNVSLYVFKLVLMISVASISNRTKYHDNCATVLTVRLLKLKLSCPALTRCPDIPFKLRFIPTNRYLNGNLAQHMYRLIASMSLV